MNLENYDQIIALLACLLFIPFFFFSVRFMGNGILIDGPEERKKKLRLKEERKLNK